MAAENKVELINRDNLVVRGRLLRIARLRDEYYVPVEHPEGLISEVGASKAGVDILTFVQEIQHRTPRCKFQMEHDQMAVLPLTTYDEWFNKTLTFKPRNKLRKCTKSGIEIRSVEFSDDLVGRIRRVYDETPVRQGKRNWNYGKDLETLKKEHATFLANSEFIGAFYKDELIGFVKVTHLKQASFLMNIVAMTCHRDKAPTNGLLARAIEICTAKKVPYLVYGIWGTKGRGLNEFKVANGFQCFAVPRYFVPLTLKGKLALKLGLHRKLIEYVPEKWILHAAALRTKWSEFKYRKSLSKRAEDAMGATSG